MEEITHKALMDLGFKCELIGGIDEKGYLDYTLETPHVNIFRPIEENTYILTTHECWGTLTMKKNKRNYMWCVIK